MGILTCPSSLKENEVSNSFSIFSLMLASFTHFNDKEKCSL